MRQRLASLLFVLGGLFSITFSPSAHAGIPVIDVANLAQAIEQVVSWAKQYQQMAQQYQQMVVAYESITGKRNLGEIFYNPALRDVIPPEAVQLYSAVQTGGLAGLSAAAQALRNAMLIYDCEERTGEDQRTCRAVLNQNAQTQAIARQSLDVVSQRVDQIEALMRQINMTEDPKAIAEMQARIQIELAQVSNDQNRIAVLREIARTEREAADQALRERYLKNLANDDDGSALMTGYRIGGAN